MVSRFPISNHILDISFNSIVRATTLNKLVYIQNVAKIINAFKWNYIMARPTK